MLLKLIYLRIIKKELPFRERETEKMHVDYVDV